VEINGYIWYRRSPILTASDSIFTARRYAKRGIRRRRVSVCVCVCVSFTLWYCIKTAKRRITQIMPHDSPGTLFSDTKDHGEIRMESPPTGATNTGGVG